MTQRVVVGWVVKAFGIRGEVAVEAAGGDPARFAPGTELFLDETGPDSLIIAGMRVVAGPRPGSRAFLLCFEGRPDRTAVEDLARRTLYQSADRLPPLSEGEYYHFQLVGLAVTGPDGQALGRLETVLDGPAADLYEVRGPSGTWFVPARKEFVAWVDLEKREMRLTDRADLLEAQRGGPDPEGEASEHRPRPRRRSPGGTPRSPRSASRS